MPLEERGVSLEELRTMLVASERENGDQFFSQFVFSQRLVQGDPLGALREGITLLDACVHAAPSSYASIGKGTPFYWLGVASFLVHDFETATFFFDAAVSEDLRKGAHPVSNNTPALRFAQVQPDEQAQAAQALVSNLHDHLDHAIAAYCARPGSAVLSMTIVRERFLQRAVSPGGDQLRTLATAFLSYFLEWGYRSTLLRVRPTEGTAEPFLMHLFKGCVLFESLLKANPTQPPRSPTLSGVLTELHRRLDIPNSVSIGGTTFPAVVASLPATDQSVTTAITYAGRVRNTVGHNLGWTAHLDEKRYDDLAQFVAAACLHAIAMLYR